jgi:3-dehydroquinate dehydratase-2
VVLRDALTGIGLPFWEVHLSDPWRREPFRSVNFIHDVATGTVVGQGSRGYHVALDQLAAHFAEAAS